MTLVDSAPVFVYLTGLVVFFWVIWLLEPWRQTGSF